VYRLCLTNGSQVNYSLHRNALKQHRSKYTKEHEYGKYLRCVSLLGAIFSNFRDVTTGFPNQ